MFLCPNYFAESYGISLFELTHFLNCKFINGQVWYLYHSQKYLLNYSGSQEQWIDTYTALNYCHYKKGRYIGCKQLVMVLSLVWMGK